MLIVLEIESSVYMRILENELQTNSVKSNNKSTENVHISKKVCKEVRYLMHLFVELITD